MTKTLVRGTAWCGKCLNSRYLICDCEITRESHLTADVKKGKMGRTGSSPCAKGGVIVGEDDTILFNATVS